MKTVRCAIYTRKSTEQGLEQEFNSLDAQREACAAYIASQKHEGWVLLPDHYDDGGISGGTLDRRSLQNLLKDVDERRVDQIVVYKIDRLTRSLADFAKLVERLDAVGASFVSVTQSFNTATSMGRLTLNVLLSFAQFEREVTSERIRDKIAASKKKGLWMGGNVPLGYDPDGRTLKINEEEAQTVRTLFGLYQSHGTIAAVKAEADQLRLRTKSKPDNFRGRSKGNVPFDRGHLHYILSNPVYAGRTRHHKLTHEGQHPAIIHPEIWDQIQIRLQDKSGRKRGLGNEGKYRSPLLGKLFDETGDRLTPSHSIKKGLRYRYYISSRLLTNPATARNGDNNGWRLSAKPLEDQIAQSVLTHLKSKLAMGFLKVPTADGISSLSSLLNTLGAKPNQKHILACVQKVSLAPGNVKIALGADATAKLLAVLVAEINADALEIELPFQFRKRGVETRLIIGEQQSEHDPILIQNIAKAHHFLDQVKAGKTFEDIASENQLSTRRLMQVIDLAFLAPDIVKKIMQGQQPLGLTSEYLQRHPMPFDWQRQREIVSTL